MIGRARARARIGLAARSGVLEAGRTFLQYRRNGYGPRASSGCQSWVQPARSRDDYETRRFSGSNECSSSARRGLSLLSSPAFVAVLILQTRYPDAVPIAGLLAIGLGSVSIALFRAKALDVGAWPRRGELATLPYGSATSAPSFCLRPSGSRWQRRRPGRCGSPLLGGVVQPLGLAAFPSVYRAVHGEPLQHTPAAKL